VFVFGALITSSVTPISYEAALIIMRSAEVPEMKHALSWRMREHPPCVAERESLLQFHVLP